MKAKILLCVLMLLMAFTIGCSVQQTNVQASDTKNLELVYTEEITEGTLRCYRDKRWDNTNRIYIVSRGKTGAVSISVSKY